MPHDVRIAFFGDSFTAGQGDETTLGWVGCVVARARQAGWDVTGYNLGIRRETTLDIQRRLRAEATPRLQRGDAHGVVVSAGINDTTLESGRRRVGIEDSLDGLGQLVDDTDAAHWPLLLIGPALIGDIEQNGRIRALSEAMADTCRRRGVPYLDLAAALRDDARWPSVVASIDGTHPPAAGYQLLSERIWPTFETWLRESVVMATAETPS